MKKLRLNMQHLNVGEALSRDQLKSIIGGEGYGGSGSPSNPSGSNSGSKKYKCCWTGTSNCSECVTCTSDCTCVSGATLTAC